MWAKYVWVVSIIVASLLASDVACAQVKLSTPPKDLPATELVAIFDTLDHNFLGFEQVFSFRDTEYSYLTRDAYKYESAFDDLSFFTQTDDRYLEKNIDSLTEQTFSGVSTDVNIWALSFNRRYRSQTQEKSLVSLTIPQVPTAESPVMTAFYVPFPSSSIQVYEGQMQFFDEKQGTIAIVTGDEKRVRILIDGALKSEDIRHVTFFASKPVVAAPPKQPETLTPNPSAAQNQNSSDEPEESSAVSIILLGVGLIVMLAGAGGAVFYLRQKRMQQLVADYSGPRGHIDVQPQHKAAHLPDAIKKVGALFHRKQKA